MPVAPIRSFVPRWLIWNRWQWSANPPSLARAEHAAERAYRSGAVSYLEWAQLQSETTAARSRQLAAAIDGHRALIEIQRLTANDPFAPQAVDRPPDSSAIRIPCVISFAFSLIYKA